MLPTYAGQSLEAFQIKQHPVVCWATGPKERQSRAWNLVRRLRMAARCHKAFHVIHVPSFPWKWKGVVKNIIFAYFFASVCFGIWGICLYLNELSAIISYLFLGFSIAFPHDLPPGKPRPAGNYSARSCVAPRPRYLVWVNFITTETCPPEAWE